MTRTRSVVVLVAVWIPLFAIEARGQTLELEEVLQSVATHDPRIRKAVESVRRAQGNRMSARGAFDPRVEGNLGLLTGGYYDIREADAELRQPTTLWGSEIYVGYRIGLANNGRWPTYADNQTLSGGEVRAGIELPIWRSGPIDEERAQRARAEELEDAARDSLWSTELNLELAAANAYWGWVSAGQTLQVTRSLVELAKERDRQLDRRLAAGSIAEFDVTDNERILYERQAFLVSAERAFEKAALALSLFLRDAQGRSIVPEPNRLPDAMGLGETPELSIDDVMEQVLMCHPDIGQARAELRAAEVDVALTRNQLAPELRAMFEYSRDLGELTGTNFDVTLPGNNFEVGVELSLPLLFRTERGRASAARAKAAENEAEVRFLEDQLGARVRDAASAVRAAQERVELNERVVSTAAELAEGERRRFEVGSSNLIFVNLREQQAAMARIRLIESIAVAQIEQTRWATTTRVECRRPSASRAAGS